MVKRFLLPLLAALIIAAMVVPGCGGTTEDPTYALTVTVNNDDWGSAVDLTGTSPYTAGTVVDIEAEAVEGFFFIEWTSDAGGDFVSTGSPTTKFTMPAAAVTITANFDELPEGFYNLILVGGAGGTVVDVGEAGYYEAGTEVEILGKPQWGVYLFDTWASDDVTLAPADRARQTFIMPEKTVTATASFELADVPGPYGQFLAEFYDDLFAGSTFEAGSFEDELDERMRNLYEFGFDYGHYWVGAGPLFLSDVNVTQKALKFDRFAAYPDDANKFLHLIEKDYPGIRTGAWVDTVTITRQPSEATGVAQVIDGTIDVYSHGMTDADLLALVNATTEAYAKFSFGSFNTMRVNPYGPEFDTGMLNPFHFAEVREAFQLLIDRDFIAEDVMQDMATPRYAALGPWGDYQRYYEDPAMDFDIKTIEALYAYGIDEENPGVDDALADFRDLVVGLTGKTGVTGTVTFDDVEDELLYDGVQIPVTLAIRSDDPQRTAIGNYIGNRMELAGFEFIARTGDMPTILSPVVNNMDEIKGGGWTMYTGGWVSTVISRDCGFWFAYFHSDLWKTGIPAFTFLEPIDWDAYDAKDGSQPFYQAALDLLFLDFETMDERRDLFDIALPGHMESSSMIYLTNNRGFAPLADDVNLAADLSGGIYGSWMWAFTAHFTDGTSPEGAGAPVPGGDLKVSMFDLLVEPWNPVAGTNTVYDMFPIRATGDMGHHPDTNTGLRLPGVVGTADVYVQPGVPVGSELPWVTLYQPSTLAPELTAPATAWGSWDADNWRVIPVSERFPDPDDRVAASMSISYYPTGTFTRPLHDGSTLSPADFIYYWILQHDRGMEGSAIYDETRVVGLTSFLKNHIAVEFIFDDPGYDLVVKSWSRIWEMDAERMVSSWYPNYAQGNGYWHTLWIGSWLEAQNVAAFGEVKAADTAFSRYWLSYVTGQGLADIRDWLLDEGYDTPAA